MQEAEQKRKHEESPAGTPEQAAQNTQQLCICFEWLMAKVQVPVVSKTQS